MPRGYYTKRTIEIDYRQILALLPGRMIIKQLIDREIAVIRQTIKAGRHPEYLALLPGLEMEERRVRGDLGTMADLMQPVDVTKAARLVTTQPLLGAPVETEDQGGKGVIDVSTLLPLPFQGGRPTTPLLMLRELMEQGEFEREAFIAKYGDTHPTLKGSGMSNALAVLRRLGVKVRKLVGKVVLVSKLTGELPTGSYKQMAKAAIEPAATDDSVRAMKKPAFNNARTPANWRKAPGGLSQSEFLIKTFNESPGHIIDISTLWKVMGAKSMNSIMVAVSHLKSKRGLNIATLGDSRYQLITKASTKRSKSE